METLPEDVLSHILKFVSNEQNIKYVCRRWMNLALRLHHGVRIYWSPMIQLSPLRLHWLRTFVTDAYIQITLRVYSASLVNEALQFLAKVCPQVRSIELDKFKFAPQTFQSLSQFSNLTRLIVNDMSSNPSSTSSEAMNALIQASSKLKSLVLRSINANITKQEILRISETCKDLEEVSFCFFTREMSDPEFWSVFVSGLPKLQRAVVKCYHQPVALDVLAPYYQRCITDSILNSNEQANYYRQPSSAFVMDTSCLPHMKTEHLNNQQDIVILQADMLAGAFIPGSLLDHLCDIIPIDNAIRKLSIPSFPGVSDPLKLTKWKCLEHLNITDARHSQLLTAVELLPMLKTLSTGYMKDDMNSIVDLYSLIARRGIQIKELFASSDNSGTFPVEVLEDLVSLNGGQHMLRKIYIDMDVKAVPTAARLIKQNNSTLESITIGLPQWRAEELKFLKPLAETLDCINSDGHISFTILQKQFDLVTASKDTLEIYTSIAPLEVWVDLVLPFSRHFRKVIVVVRNPIKANVDDIVRAGKWYTRSIEFVLPNEEPPVPEHEAEAFVSCLQTILSPSTLRVFESAFTVPSDLYLFNNLIKLNISHSKLSHELIERFAHSLLAVEQIEISGPFTGSVDERRLFRRALARWVCNAGRTVYVIAPAHVRLEIKANKGYMHFDQQCYFDSVTMRWRADTVSLLTIFNPSDENIVEDIVVVLADRYPRVIIELPAHKPEIASVVKKIVSVPAVTSLDAPIDGPDAVEVIKLHGHKLTHIRCSLLSISNRTLNMKYLPKRWASLNVGKECIRAIRPELIDVLIIESYFTEEDLTYALRHFKLRTLDIQMQSLSAETLNCIGETQPNLMELTLLVSHLPTEPLLNLTHCLTRLCSLSLPEWMSSLGLESHFTARAMIVKFCERYML